MSLVLSEAVQEPELAARSLYHCVLGEGFAVLPMQLQEIHGVRRELHAVGKAQIERGRNRLGHILARLAGLPPAGRNIPLTLTLIRKDDKEFWRFDFAGCSIQSTLEPGRGRYAGMIVERFGPLAFSLTLKVGAIGLNLELQGVSFFGILIPKLFWPRIIANETVLNGRFAFDVTCDLPLIGRLIRYRGTLEPETE